MSTIEIPLTRGKFAIIDKEDLEFVMRYTWKYHVSRNGKHGYAWSEGRNPISMHGHIINCPNGMMVDHKNGNGLDNRRENIRICTVAENNRNRKKIESSIMSKYKGVSKNGKTRWQASLTSHGKRYYLGRFDTEEDAARAYNKKAWELHGEFSNVNESLRYTLGVGWKKTNE